MKNCLLRTRNPRIQNLRLGEPKRTPVPSPKTFDHGTLIQVNPNDAFLEQQTRQSYACTALFHPVALTLPAMKMALDEAVS